MRTVGLGLRIYLVRELRVHPFSIEVLNRVSVASACQLAQSVFELLVLTISSAFSTIYGRLSVCRNSLSGRKYSVLTVLGRTS